MILCESLFYSANNLLFWFIDFLTLQFDDQNNKNLFLLMASVNKWKLHYSVLYVILFALQLK